jgi:hypothetical protein
MWRGQAQASDHGTPADNDALEGSAIALASHALYIAII